MNTAIIICLPILAIILVSVIIGVIWLIPEARKTPVDPKPWKPGRG